MSEAEPAVAAEPTAAELEFQKARAIIEPLARDGKSEEDMLVAMIREGFLAKKSFKLIRMSLEDLGKLLSTKDRNTQVSEILLKNDFAPEEYSDLKDCIAFLTSELECTDEKQALKAVKKFAKENKIELPKAPKGSRSSGKSFRSRALRFMVEHANEDVKVFVKFLEDEERTQTQINYYTRSFETGQEMAKAIIAAQTEAKTAA
jgi:hypothetical protein